MQSRTFKWRADAVRWRQFSRKNYAVFQSLGRVVCISVLTVATLTHATPATAQAKTALSAARTGVEEGKLKLQSADISVLEEGDLLFNVQLPDGGLGQAITDVTEGFALQCISHVAIVCKRPDGLFALEASGEHGVWLNPINSFIHDADHSADGAPLVLVGRLKDRSNIHASVEKALTYLGKAYDKLYLPSDDEIYCSELVQLSYTDLQGNAVFPQIPMSFHDQSGQITEFWKSYYKKVGMEVPEGWPGTNPGGISRSDRLDIIYQLTE